MAMNLSGTNMAVRSQMIGLPQQVRTGRVEQQQETPIFKQPEKQKESQETPKESFTKSSGEEQPKAHRRKEQQVMTRYVSTTGKKTETQKAQTKEAKNAEEQKQAAENKASYEPKAKVPLDNAARIGLMYKSQQRQAKGNVQNDNTNAGQQKQLKSFLNNLKQYVEQEYKQYGTPENSLYTKRNLREILSALGYETKAFDNKAAKDRKERTSTGSAKVKSYNKHYDVSARKHLKLFNEDPMQQQDSFDMVA